MAQLVTINLPHIVYEAGGRQNKINELLSDRLFKSKATLLLKKKILGRNVKNKLLPFMSQRVSRKDPHYLDPDKQAYAIGFVGLNEMVKEVTGKELHESRDSAKYGLKMVRRMRRVIDAYKAESGLNFTLARTSSEACSRRFPKVDSNRFPEKEVRRKYSNSFQVRPRAKVSSSLRIKTESPFHRLLNGGALSNIYLNRRSLNAEFIKARVTEIISKSKLSYYRFIMK